MTDSGIVVIGYTTDAYLMLDIDQKRPEKVVEWTGNYTKRHHLGSALIMKTSDVGQVDLFGNKLLSFSVIFGTHIPWQENMQHIDDAFKDKMVDKKFRKMRFQGFITERVNRKTHTISHPKIFKYISNGSHKGCFDYLKWWVYYRKLG